MSSYPPPTSSTSKTSRRPRSTLTATSEAASETGSVLVDWERHEDGAASTKSFPVLSRPHALSMLGDTSARNAVSLYDSDSDSENDVQGRSSSQQRQYRPTLSSKLFRALTGGSDNGEEGNANSFLSPTGVQTDAEDDGSIHSDDCMILTDDEDDVAAPMAESNDGLTTERLQEQQDLIQSSTSRDSITQKETAAMAAVFVEKHPWRKQSSKKVDLLAPQEELIPEFAAHGATRALETELSMDSSVSTPRLGGDGKLRPKFDELSDGDDVDSESSTSEDSDTSLQSSVSVISDPDLELDYDALEFIPNSFVSEPQVLASMLDPSLQTMSKSDSSRFAFEHALLLRSILQLLAERDLVGVEADINDPTTIIKKGPLKKLSHSVGRTTWKVKYVEIRRGSFSYFEDNSHIKRGGVGRKTILLKSSKSVVEVVKKNVFSLAVEGGPTRMFMTNSEDERVVWSRAIQEAMLGGGIEDSGHDLDITLYRGAVEQYQAKRTQLGRAQKRREYISCCESLYQTPLQVPVQWIRDNIENDSEARGIRNPHASMQKRMKASIADFWRNLSRETVCINGYSINSQRPRGGERIVGALTRCILDFDKTSPMGIPGEMSELQAISYARDVLSAVLRIRSKDDAQVSLNHLCQNPGLVIVVPFARLQPLSLRVAHGSSDFTDHEPSSVTDVSGWVSTRSKVHKNWKKRFCVVSEGVLSWFEHGSPRPHGLRGQFVLSGAFVMEAKEKLPQEEHLFILLVGGRDGEKERQLAFQKEEVYVDWKDTMQRAIDSCSGLTDMSTPRTWKKSKPPAGRLIRGASEGGVKIMRGATDILRVIRPTGSKTPMEKSQPQERRESERSNSMLSVSSSIASDKPTRMEPTVQIVAEGASVYKIITSEPTGNESKDTWITVRGTFTQTFHLGGGAHGRLTKGDELVSLEFRQGAVSVEEFNHAELE